MSADWHFEIALSRPLDLSVTVRFLDAARAVDMVPFLARTTRDGLDDVIHASVEELVEAWTWEGGAFQIESSDHYFVVSGGEGWLGIGVRRSQFERSEQEAAWAAVNHLLDAVLEIVPVTYILGWEEDMIENLDRIGLLDLHLFSEQIDDRIAAAQLPLVLGWLNVAPADSSLGRQLRAVADAVGIAPSIRGRHIELRMTPEPWGEALQALFDANRRWRALT